MGIALAQSYALGDGGGNDGSGSFVVQSMGLGQGAIVVPVILSTNNNTSQFHPSGQRNDSSSGLGGEGGTGNNDHEYAKIVNDDGTLKRAVKVPISAKTAGVGGKKMWGNTATSLVPSVSPSVSFAPSYTVPMLRGVCKTMGSTLALQSAPTELLRLWKKAPRLVRQLVVDVHKLSRLGKKRKCERWVTDLMIEDLEERENNILARFAYGNSDEVIAMLRATGEG